METEETDPTQPRFYAHVPVPSQQDIEAALLLRKKQELLEKYASPDLQGQINNSELKPS